MESNNYSVEKRYSVSNIYIRFRYVISNDNTSALTLFFRFPYCRDVLTFRIFAIGTNCSRNFLSTPITYRI